MTTLAQIIGEIQMVLAQRAAGEIDDAQCVEQITRLMDSPEAVVASLDLVPPQTARPPEEDDPK